MKRDWRKIVKKVFIILLVPMIVCAFIATNQMNKNAVCKTIDIEISNADKVAFFTAEEMKTMLLQKQNITEGQTLLKDINIQNLEAIVQGNPWVKSAEVFINQSNEVKIEIEQKEPVLRWINGDELQCYLDADGKVIPNSDAYSAMVPIVTSPKMGVTQKDEDTKRNMLAVCKYIQQDSFWNAMVTQININKSHQIELIPALANQTILFGDSTQIQNKFERLLSFYQVAIPRKGWSTYKDIDVRFNGQIVATKNDSVFHAQQNVKLLATVKKPMATSKEKNNSIVKNNSSSSSNKQ
jgi:cell division protein FtsQ